MAPTATGTLPASQASLICMCMSCYPLQPPTDIMRILDQFSKDRFRNVRAAITATAKSNLAQQPLLEAGWLSLLLLT